MSRNTSILLGLHFERFIEKQLASGRYSSASEVVRESLRLMEEREKDRDTLRQALIEGEASGIAGPVELEKITQAGRAAAKSRRKGA